MFNRKRQTNPLQRQSEADGERETAQTEREETEIEIVNEINKENDSTSDDDDLPILEVSQRNWELHRNTKNQRRKILNSAISQPFIADDEAFDLGRDEDNVGNVNYDDNNNNDDNNEYYDPAKLSFIFSTPSPLIKKLAQFEESDKTNDLNRSPIHSYNINNHDDDVDNDDDEVEEDEGKIVTKIEDLLKFTKDLGPML